MTAPSAFAGIAEKLGKLIPRLASDHDGEITATVAVIGRTLATARLDWHDLAQRVAQPSFDEVMATSAPLQPSRPTWPPPASPSKTPAASQKPGREPARWPTWAIMTRFERLAWMDAIVGAADLMNARKPRLSRNSARPTTPCGTGGRARTPTASTATSGPCGSVGGAQTGRRREAGTGVSAPRRAREGVD